MSKIRTLSPSQVCEFTNCKRHWWFNRVMGIETGKDTGVRKFGKTVHKFLEKYHKGTSMETIHKEMNDELRGMGSDGEVIRSIMANYATYNESMEEGDIYYIPSSEHNICEKELFCPIFCDKGFMLHGLPDLIFRKGDTVYVVDHKTSDELWPMWKFYVNTQFEFYHLLVSKQPEWKGLDVKVMIQVIRRLKGSRTPINELFQRFIVDTFDTRSDIIMLDQVIEDILRTTDFPYGDKGPHCGWCDYLNLCQLGNDYDEIKNALDKWALI